MIFTRGPVRKHWPTRAGTLATAGVLALAGCTSGPDSPSAEDTAADLARALSTGRFGTVSVEDRTPAQARAWWRDRAAPLADADLVVRAGDVTEAGDTASARLAFTWKLAGERPWTYRTDVDLARRAGRWQVRLAPGLLQLRPGERLEVTHEAADRADILGAGGSRLVTERPVLRFGIDKTKVGPGRQDGAARRLAALVGVDPGPFAARVAAAGDEAFVEAIVLRLRDVTPAISAGYRDIPGALPVPDEIPLAPTREFARPILGTVGPVTAEIVEESDGALGIGDQAGLSGLEQRYDEQLRGTPGVTVSAVRGETTRRLFATEPVPGEPLRTTLVPRTQTLAERVLAGVTPASALVAVRVSNGDIVAAASGPGSDGYSTATLGQYAPGSTFKIVSSLALLRAGLTPTSPVDCPPSTVVDGKKFENYDDYPATALGRIDLRTALANSCNTAFIGEHERIPQAAIAEAAASLGLGTDHDLGFPAYFGAVPARATETEHAASLIGQGKVVASPMAMAAVVASVQAGRTAVPRLLADRRPDASAPGRPLTRREAGTLRQLLRGVVTDGSGAFLADVPRDPVIAKTGTAEFGTDDPPKTHAWMVAAQGDLAVAVFVDVGESGSATAGPLLETFLRHL